MKFFKNLSIKKMERLKKIENSKNQKKYQTSSHNGKNERPK